MDLLPLVQDEDTCREYLEEQCWHGEPICPHCHMQTKRHYRITQSGRFRGLYKCCKCRKRFTVTVGTMFENSHISLRKWFLAIYMFLSHKKGVSSMQLARDLGVTQKTAWFILGRIRYNMKDKMRAIFGDMTQIDETYVGGRNKGRVKHNQGRSIKTKTPVVGLVSSGKAYTVVVPNTSGWILKPIVRAMVKTGSTIITDGWGGYKGLARDYRHEVVDHGSGEYVRGKFHTNTIEGYWSQLKRGIFGIYHKVSPKHLPRYCGEFDFRYNTRNIDDFTRFKMFIISTYKRLRYSDLINSTEYAFD